MEALPYEDAAFDVVSSSCGVMFAPDHEAVAGELARVCTSGGRIGLACWRPDGTVAEIFRLKADFQPAPPPGVASPFEWGREEHVTNLLEGDFDLEFHRLASQLSISTAEDAWELLSTSYGPTKVLADSLDEGRREELRRRFVELDERHDDGTGVRMPRTYLLTLGKRR